MISQPLSTVEFIYKNTFKVPKLTQNLFTTIISEKG